jgi:myo-inositol-1(or 4)-monophosphatase
VLERALSTFEDLCRAGAASLDLAWTASGVFDGYFEQHLGTWDVAAGALLVREAGGIVTDCDGGDDWLRAGHLVAANAKLQPLIRERIVH